MNWVTTNIRLPEETYMELKIEAARKRKSLAEIVRQKVVNKKTQTKPKKKDVEKIMKELDKLAKEISKQNPGISLSEKLIEMRYEQ